MGKNRRNLKFLYPNGLPVTLSTDAYGINLPELIPHNPISWVMFTMKYMYIQTKSIPKFIIDVTLEDDVFKVTNEFNMNRLWSHGFFGKGSLSRSDPSWVERTSTRLGLGDQNGVASEEITKQRREERKVFKQERSKIQNLELKQRQGLLNANELIELEQLKDKLNQLKNSGHIVRKSKSSSIVMDIRDEDEVLLEDGGLDNLEYLQLQGIETFFLKYALNTIEVIQNGAPLSTKQLFDYCQFKDSNFVMHYAVYHHFRSLGWCVRSGIKFGCDMLLYKRGPPFSHAEFAILVIPTREENINWIEISTIARVIGGVKKNLVLCFVDEPDINHKTDDEDIESLLKQYKVTEILYRRWSPSRSRD